jgi:hypothetical protein
MLAAIERKQQLAAQLFLHAGNVHTQNPLLLK